MLQNPSFIEMQFQVHLVDGARVLVHSLVINRHNCTNQPRDVSLAGTLSVLFPPCTESGSKWQRNTSREQACCVVGILRVVGRHSSKKRERQQVIASSEHSDGGRFNCLPGSLTCIMQRRYATACRYDAGSKRTGMGFEPGNPGFCGASFRSTH